jgi:SAM-dependent methyltransferase
VVPPDQSNLVAAQPSAWLQRFVHLIPDGPVLDLACGAGRHTRWLAAQGFTVTAIDIDVSGVTDLKEHARVTILQADLERDPWPFEAQQFAGITVTNYLHRPLLSQLATALCPHGVLLYETFARGHERLGRPQNPDFLLRPGELLNIFARNLQIVAYETGQENKPRPAIRQKICAVRSDELQTLSPVQN